MCVDIWPRAGSRDRDLDSDCDPEGPDSLVQPSRLPAHAIARRCSASDCGAANYAKHLNLKPMPRSVTEFAPRTMIDGSTDSEVIPSPVSPSTKVQVPILRNSLRRASGALASDSARRTLSLELTSSSSLMPARQTQAEIQGQQFFIIKNCITSWLVPNREWQIRSIEVT